MTADLQEALTSIAAALERIERKIEEASTPPRALTRREAARLLSRSEATVKRMIAAGELRTVQIHGTPMVPFSEIVRVTSVASAPEKGPRLVPTGNALTRARAARKSSAEEAAKVRAALRAARKR